MVNIDNLSRPMTIFHQKARGVIMNIGMANFQESFFQRSNVARRFNSGINFDTVTITGERIAEKNASSTVSISKEASALWEQLKEDKEQKSDSILEKNGKQSSLTEIEIETSNEFLCNVSRIISASRIPNSPRTLRDPARAAAMYVEIRRELELKYYGEELEDLLAQLYSDFNEALEWLACSSERGIISVALNEGRAGLEELLEMIFGKPINDILRMMGAADIDDINAIVDFMNNFIIQQGSLARQSLLDSTVPN